MTVAQEKIDSSAIRFKAMTLMAGREQCRTELFRKLSARYSVSSEAAEKPNEGPDVEQLIQSVLDGLEADGLLSDERFAEMFIQFGVRKGRGPLRLRQELRQKGISSELAAIKLSDADVDWFDLALRVCHKKFSANCSTNMADSSIDALPDNTSLSYKEKARQMRFLQSRGFSQEHIAACFGG